jgi:hypothetical protein
MTHAVKVITVRLKIEVKETMKEAGGKGSEPKEKIKEAKRGDAKERK